GIFFPADDADGFADDAEKDRRESAVRISDISGMFFPADDADEPADGAEKDRRESAGYIYPE
ncbi:MAG TPA: hypothetical protein PKG90_12220, partial [Chitinophagaceae bacterium]|nr:hypothetical protein [Chitinophagaceae bacterium]HNU14761.1 hypothetical protein [Chitinophagaceae bacterium]